MVTIATWATHADIIFRALDHGVPVSVGAASFDAIDAAGGPAVEGAFIEPAGREDWAFRQAIDPQSAGASTTYRYYHVAQDDSSIIYVDEAWQGDVRSFAMAGSISTTSGSVLAAIFFEGDARPAESSLYERVSRSWVRAA